jgi:hypothetical protein
MVCVRVKTAFAWVTLAAVVTVATACAQVADLLARLPGRPSGTGALTDGATPSVAASEATGSSTPGANPDQVSSTQNPVAGGVPDRVTSTPTPAPKDPDALDSGPIAKPAGFEPLEPLYTQRVDALVAAGSTMLADQGSRRIFVSADLGAAWKETPVPLKLDIRFHTDGDALYASGFDGLHLKVLKLGDQGAWQDAAAGLPTDELFVISSGAGYVAAVGGRRTYLLRNGAWSLIASSGPTGAGSTSQNALAPLVVSTAGTTVYALASPTDFPASAVQLYALDSAASQPAWRRVGPYLGGNSATWTMAIAPDRVFLAGDEQSFSMQTGSATPSWEADPLATRVKFIRSASKVYRTGNRGASAKLQQWSSDDAKWVDLGSPPMGGGGTVVEIAGQRFAAGPRGLARLESSSSGGVWERLPLRNAPARVTVHGGPDRVAVSTDSGQSLEGQQGGLWKPVLASGVPADAQFDLEPAGHGYLGLSKILSYGPVPSAATVHVPSAGGWSNLTGYLPRGVVPNFAGATPAGAYAVDYDGSRLFVAFNPGGNGADWKPATENLPMAFPLSPAAAAVVADTAYVLQASSFGTGTFEVKAAPIGASGLSHWTNVALPNGRHEDAALLTTATHVFLATRTVNPDLRTSLHMSRLVGREFVTIGGSFDLTPASMASPGGSHIVSDGFYWYAGGISEGGTPGIRRLGRAGGQWEAVPGSLGTAKEITSLAIGRSGAGQLVIGTDIGAFAGR